MQYTIPLIVFLNILCPQFQALFASPGSWLLEPIAIVLLCLNMSRTKVSKSWHYHDRVASPLFADNNSSRPHMPIEKCIRMQRIEAHKVQHSERKYAPSLSLVESPSTAKKSKKNKQTLKKAVLATTPTADPPPPLSVDYSLNNMLLADLPIPLLSSAQIAEGSKDLLEGGVFTRSTALLED